jgi:hypothetical protein
MFREKKIKPYMQAFIHIKIKKKTKINQCFIMNSITIHCGLAQMN